MNGHRKLEKSSSSTDSGALASSTYDSHQSSGGESFEGDTEGEGYDLEFVPAADPRYECPICLLILRNPVQTECGHRFCKACILKWFRKSTEPACPVDKMVVSEKQLFPDNFAKREISVLSVRCRNSSKGCQAVVTLKAHESHLKECEFELQPCPNRCSGIFYRKELKRHLQESCPKRIIKCPHCSSEEAYEFMQNHLENCQRRGVTCDYCGQHMLRQEVENHLHTTCQAVPVRCIFSPLGCQHSCGRKAMENHMVDNTQEHMKVLAKAVSSLLKMTHHRSSQPDPSYQLGLLLQDQNHPHSPDSGLTGPAELPTFNMDTITSGYLTMSAHEGLTSTASSSDAFQRGLLTSSVPPMLSSSLEDNMPSSAASQILANLNQAASGISRLQMKEMPGLKSAAGRDLIDILGDKIHHQEGKLSRLSQDLADYKGKTKTLRDTIEAQNKYIKKLENQISDITARTFNGLYIWKIENFSTKRNEAIIGKNPVLHSPAFYSSPYGYKLCIRVNLNGVDTASGTHISLFVHFLRGDFDDILDWPFTGHISMGILDQNENCQARRPISESFEANPSFAAFQRPVSSRNHKGFGYMEFVPIELIERGTYIRNDTLVIRVKIQEN